MPSHQSKPKTKSQTQTQAKSKAKAKADANTAPPSTSKSKSAIDWRLVLLVVFFIAVAVAAVAINLSRTKDDSSKITSALDIDNGDLKINWDRYQTVDIALTDTLNITESGTYHLTGILEDGKVNIDTGVGEVRLILDNVTIKNSNGPAIYCASAEDLVIELVGENYLEDGSTFSTEYDEDVDGVIYSKADLTFNGDGELNIKSNHQDAIVGKDDIKFDGGVYDISASDDAIRGKDSVYIVNGEFTINSVADAIKATNETDQGKGFILIENGDLDITSGAKGVKATKDILVYDGDLLINSYDDAIHSNNYVGIVDGQIEINSGDDGIHADRELIIDGGSINLTKSYEGLEAQAITINGGNINVVATDDGINAGGGSDSSSTNRIGANDFSVDEDCIITINDGNIYVNSGGDGIDSNGYLYFIGGKVAVDGPTNNGNGALDATGGIYFNGGEVVAIGASGMAEDLGQQSNLPSISLYFDSLQSAGANIVIKNSNDETILEHTSAKTFNHLAAGSSYFVIGETYTIYIDGVEYQDFTLSSIVTTLGNSARNFGPRR